MPTEIPDNYHKLLCEIGAIRASQTGTYVGKGTDAVDISKTLSEAQSVIQNLLQIIKNSNIPLAPDDPILPEGVLYHSPGNTPSENISDHAKFMRVGTIKPVERAQAIDPVFLLRLRNEGEWEDQFRIYNTEQEALGAKVLHNV